jgi:actin related protein 2/3 complex subunit 3
MPARVTASSVCLLTSVVQAYHSSLNEAASQYRQVGNLSLLPLRTSIRGPAPKAESNDEPDIIDEAIRLFRANCLFRNYEIYGSADRVLVYLILFISDCLTRIQAKAAVWSLNEAGKQLQSHAVDNFALPGEPGFPINEMYDKAGNRMDQGPCS